MARITRKELKRNELVETFGRTVGFVSQHRKGAVEIIAAAVAVLVLAGGFLLFRGWRERQAGEELSAALEILEAPLASDPAAVSASRSFPTAAEREREAAKHLAKAAAKGGTAAGRAARVILSVRSDKPAPAASETLAKAARDRQAEVAAAAEIDTARFLVAQGKTTEAIDRLKRAIESPESAAPKDALLFALGEAYEKAGSASDARATYQRIVNDYPNSPYRSPARERIPG